MDILNQYQLLSAKPVVFLANVSKKGTIKVLSKVFLSYLIDYLRKGNKYLPLIAEYLKEQGGENIILPISCEFELELLDMGSAGTLDQYLSDNPTHKSALNKILKTGYHALSLIHFFTSGKDEVRAWTIRYIFSILCVLLTEK